MENDIDEQNIIDMVEFIKYYKYLYYTYFKSQLVT